jgi:2-C-methyl-D-erythritol 4-phosphate cytidylyltransferase
VGVVLLAAGQGIRAGGGTPKQFREVAGVPLALRALRPFAAHPAVSHVALVVPPATAVAPPPWLAGLRGGALQLVTGGAERQDSVAAGVRALPAECRIVLVHDAARPFVSRTIIDAVVDAARSGRAALAAVPVSDTVKEAAPPREPSGPVPVLRTVPREALWRAQTPQGFPRPLLERALAAAAASGRSATDDAQMVEWLGEEVLLVPDDSGNLKVTTGFDFELAELLAARESAAPGA